MRRTILWTVVGVIALALWMEVRGAGGGDSRTKETMRLKLHYAQSVLEGIALEDYDLIDINAGKLKSLSQSAGWQFRQSAEYQRHTGEFARRAEALVKAAERKNLDAATVAYFQLTATCVACHRHLRGSTQASRNSGGVEITLTARR